MTTAREIETALSERYAAPEWAFLTQVRNGTGFRATVRTADALAMSLYPSRGLYLHGFEIKVAKSDWTRELREPDKAEEIARFCHCWWIAAPKGVVPVDELPVNWGLLELAGDKLKIAKQAVFREAVPLTMPMLASIFRNISTAMVPAARVEKDIRDAVNRDRIAHSQANDYEIARLKKQLDVWDAFAKTSGVRPETWNLGEVSEAVRLLSHAGSGRLQRDLSYVHSTVRGLADRLETAINELTEAGVLTPKGED